MSNIIGLPLRAIYLVGLCGAFATAEPPCVKSSPEVKAVLDAARKSAEETKDTYVRSELLHEVAKGYAANGDFDSAVQVIRVDSRLMWHASDDLARDMLRCGESAQVKAIAPTLQGRSKSLMLQWLAEWDAKHEDPTGSQAALSQIEDADIRNEAQFNIITRRAVEGDAKVAEVEYRRIVDAADSGQVSADDLVAGDMAVLYVMKGDVDSASASINKMKSGEKVFSLYTAIQIMAEKKDKAGADRLSKAALRIAHPFLKDPDQAYPISLLATALAKLGMFDDAIELANAIPDTQRRDEALVMIATYLIADKQESRARTLMDSLSKLPDSNGALDGERQMAWVRFAMAQANAGDGEGALKTLEVARDPRMDSLSKWQRAYAEARAGRSAQGRDLALQIASEFPRDERGRALRLVAAVNAHEKGASDVMSWASQLSAPEDRVSAYLGVADGLLGNPTQEIPPYFQD
jgi:hypothetical protein